MAKIVSKTATHKSPERLSRPRQRQKLIDACITALYLHGPSRTTIDKVVSIADMSPGIVNFYFESKATLLLSTLEYLAVEFEELVIAPLLASLDQPAHALERLIALYFDPALASCRKVSVWYSFWGEASSRSEYQTICGKRDQAFNDLVRDLVARLIVQTGAVSLDADAIALGLVGALEILWQEIAFQSEPDVDRTGARRRCLAYLQSVFPNDFGTAGRSRVATFPQKVQVQDCEAIFANELKLLFYEGWQWIAHNSGLPRPGDYTTLRVGNERMFAVRTSANAMRAFRNACSRKPHELAVCPAGSFGDAITCSVDGSRYNLTGTAEVQDCGNLVELPITIEHGLVFTKISGEASAPPAIPGKDFVALGLLQPLAPWTEDACQADWKLIVEHWADAYAAVTSQVRFDRLPGEDLREGKISAYGMSWRTNLRSRLLLWPNLLIETYPDGLTIRQALPKALGTSSIRMHHYGRLSADKDERARSSRHMRLARAWAREDAAIITSTSTGLDSSFRRQIRSEEEKPGDFHLWLSRSLPGLIG